MNDRTLRFRRYVWARNLETGRRIRLREHRRTTGAHAPERGSAEPRSEFRLDDGRLVEFRPPDLFILVDPRTHRTLQYVREA